MIIGTGYTQTLIILRTRAHYPFAAARRMILTIITREVLTPPLVLRRVVLPHHPLPAAAAKRQVFGVVSAEDVRPSQTVNVHCSFKQQVAMGPVLERTDSRITSA